jgi:hypothetical protein
MPNPMTMVLFLPLVLGAQNSTAGPTQPCKAVQGTFEAQIRTNCAKGSMCTDGTLTGGLKGHYSFQGVPDIKSLESPAPASVHVFVGESTVKLDNGNTLVGIDTGVLDKEPGHGGFASLITWKDGGQISLRGTLGEHATKGEYAGTACGAR